MAAVAVAVVAQYHATGTNSDEPRTHQGVTRRVPREIPADLLPGRLASNLRVPPGHMNHHAVEPVRNSMLHTKRMSAAKLLCNSGRSCNNRTRQRSGPRVAPAPAHRETLRARMSHRRARPSLLPTAAAQRPREDRPRESRWNRCLARSRPDESATCDCSVHSAV